MNAVCEKYHDPELQALRTEVRAKSDSIKALVRGVYVPLSEGCVTVTAIQWALTPSANVRMRLCALDLEDPEHTVVNVVFDAEGTLGLHHQPEQLTLFCLSGSVLEMISGKIVNEGEVLSIGPHQNIELASTRAYLTLTWKPPLETAEVVNPYNPRNCNAKTS